MKYEVVISEGCTAFYTSVNNKLWSGEYEVLSEEEKEEFVDFLCEEIKKQLKESTIDINDVISIFQCDESEWSNDVCDQCGDSVSTRTWRFG